MRLPRSTTCLVLVLSTCLAAQRGGDRRDRADAPAQAVELQHFTYETAEMDAPRVRMGVYLPADYADAKNKDRRYPWALWLHGRGESHRKFHVDGGARALDEVRGKNEIPDLVFVALSVGNPVYVDGVGGEAGDQEKMITDLLPEFLGKKYRLESDRSKRALMGVSMGGFGALKIALRHPDRFATVAAHSSALMPEDPSKLPRQYQRMAQRVFGDPVDAKKWAAHMPLALAASLEIDTLKSMHIYFDAGSADRYGFAPANESLHELLAKRGVAHEFELVEGGGHSWGSGSLQKQLLKSLRFVGKALAGAGANGKPAGDAAPAPGAKKDGDRAPASAGDAKR